jgi:hypothetical protein
MSSREISKIRHALKLDDDGILILRAKRYIVSKPFPGSSLNIILDTTHGTVYSRYKLQ